MYTLLDFLKKPDLDDIQLMFVVLLLIPVICGIILINIGVDDDDIIPKIGIIYQLIGFVFILLSAWKSYTVKTEEKAAVVINPVIYKRLWVWGIIFVMLGLFVQLYY